MAGSDIEYWETCDSRLDDATCISAGLDFDVLEMSTDCPVPTRSNVRLF